MRQEHAKRNNRLARSEVGDAFIDAGFSLVSLANNHTLDRGEDGVLRSLDYWSDKESILTAGSYCTQEDRDEIRKAPQRQAVLRKRLRPGRSEGGFGNRPDEDHCGKNGSRRCSLPRCLPGVVVG